MWPPPAKARQERDCTEREHGGHELSSADTTASKSTEQRRYPWGSDFFMSARGQQASSMVRYRANLGHRVQSMGGTVPVTAFESVGGSALGLSQMVGNVWEWTRTTFYPFPGYQMDFPYRENAAPWFGFSKVAKGGAWSTSEYLAHSKHRNFYDAGGRREVAIGFRVVRNLR